MRAHYTIIFLITSLATSFQAQFASQTDPKSPHSTGPEKTRRILHQPLFPIDSAPPQPPPPPPFSDEDQPFSGELPTGPTLGQVQQQPPPLPAIGAAVANPAATPPPSSPPKKLAVVISSAILTSGMLAGLAFYLYKHRANQTADESLKLVASQRIDEESRTPPPSTFLSLPEPPDGTLPNRTNHAGNSPYQKLSTRKKYSRYRPSPELQPLPPLTKQPPLPPPPPSGLSAPPPMSSSDDETHSSRDIVAISVPHSKRTSPRSRFSASSSSPDTSSKPTVIQSVRQSLPPGTTSLGPIPPYKTLSYYSSPKRAKSSPPSTSGNGRQRAVIPIPPPPPPRPRKNGDVKIYTSLPFVSKQMERLGSKSPRLKGPDHKTRPVEKVKNVIVGSSEKLEGEENEEGSRPVMKTLHWDKVGATSDTATVWDGIDSNSFRLNEDAMKSLFSNSVSSVPKQTARKLVLPSFEQENRILDAKKSQNIAILLRALNVTREEVSEALLDGNPEGLGPELFETLVKMAPSKEEEIKLKNYKDDASKLGPAERFLRTILDIPFAFKRVEAMLYRTNFDSEVKYLRKSFQTLEEASEELKSSRLFLKLLEAVLRTGNRMNTGTNRGDAKAFKLDTLLKLADIKGTDGKTTLLHFVVQEIIRAEVDLESNDQDFKKQQELRVVAGLSKELGNVKKAAGMDSDVLSGYVSKLETGLEKIKQVLKNEDDRGKYLESMRVFVKEAGDEISRVRAEERKAMSLVKEVTRYFHGDSDRQEANKHPLRIFMVVRDFLAVLDNVCRDVGRMQDREAMGSGRSFRISANAVPLPVLSRYKMQSDTSSDDEDDNDV